MARAPSSPGVGKPLLARLAEAVDLSGSLRRELSCDAARGPGHLCSCAHYSRLSVAATSSRQRTGGGAAGAGGYSFAARVAAKLSVDVIAAEHWPTRWGLSESVTLTALAIETAQAVDDLEAVTSGGGVIYMQAKRGVSASSAETSPLSSAVDQFVRQYLGVGRPKGQRAFDAARDRLVLVCGASTGNPVGAALPQVLSRLRDVAPTSVQEFERTLRNRGERDSFAALVLGARRSWEKHAGAKPSDGELIGLLRVLHVDRMEVEDGEREEDGALRILRTDVLVEPDQARLAWSTLIEKALRAAGAQSGATRAGLRELLSNAGVRLGVPAEARADVERLRVRTETALAHLGPHAGLAVGGDAGRLARELAGPLLDAVLQRSCLLVGVPGSGKTGALHTLALALQERGHDVVVLAADQLSAADLPELSSKLGLARDIDAVLADWPGQGRGVLIIDALDAARGSDGPAGLLDLIERVGAVGGRWTVVASVRSFDLRHNRALRAALPAAGAPLPHTTAEFADVSHFTVDELSDGELEQLQMVARPVHEVVQTSPTALRELVRNPFNLTLLARLVESEITPESLRPIRTQLELLSRYWEHRVLSPASGRDAREALLQALGERALHEMRLQVLRAAVTAAPAGDAVRELLQAGVLAEVPPGGVHEPERLAFSHHVLFDYGFARHVLPKDPSSLVSMLAAQPEAVLLARPSLVMLLGELWELGGQRDRFWHTALALADDTLDDPVRLVGPAMIAETVGAPTDLEPLLMRVVDLDADTAARAQALLTEIVSALLARGTDARPLQGAEVELWAAVAARVARVEGDGVADPLRLLVFGLWREAFHTRDDAHEEGGDA